MFKENIKGCQTLSLTNMGIRIYHGHELLMIMGYGSISTNRGYTRSKVSRVHGTRPNPIITIY